MKTRLYLLVVCACAALLSACGGGGSPVTPNPSSFLVVSAPDGHISVVGNAGSVDAGSTVTLEAPASGTGTAAANGSVRFSGTSGGGSTVKVDHSKAGTPLVATITPVTLASRVNTPLFSTGQAPNDMLLAANSLYVVSSLDNRVDRFNFSGDSLANHVFPASTSPSYLALNQSSSELFVVSNGTNSLDALDSTTLAALVPAKSHLLPSGGLDFLGPGKPVILGEEVVLPVALIQSFNGGATIYEGGNLDLFDFGGAQQDLSADTSADNGQVAVQTPDGSEILVTSAGDLVFDAQFHPSVTSHSALDIFDASQLADNSQPLASIDLGPVGASAFVVTPDGHFAYVGNLLNGNVYKVDLQNQTVVRGGANPISLTPEFTYISDLTLTPDGKLLLATSFNTDELFVIDTTTDTVNPAPYPGPFDLKLDPNLLAGTINVETDGQTAFVLYSVGNAVGAVDLF